jgi:hypothetical protein
VPHLSAALQQLVAQILHAPADFSKALAEWMHDVRLQLFDGFAKYIARCVFCSIPEVILLLRLQYLQYRWRLTDVAT